MGGLLRKASAVSVSLNPLARVAGKSNTLRQIMDPAGIAQQQIAEGAPINARTILDPGDWMYHQQIVDAENALNEQRNKKPPLMPNEEELRKAARLASQRRRNRGRASTILGSDSETLG